MSPVAINSLVSGSLAILDLLRMHKSCFKSLCVAMGQMSTNVVLYKSLSRVWPGKWRNEAMSFSLQLPVPPCSSEMKGSNRFEMKRALNGRYCSSSVGLNFECFPPRILCSYASDLNLERNLPSMNLAFSSLCQRPVRFSPLGSVRSESRSLSLLLGFSLLASRGADV